MPSDEVPVHTPSRRPARGTLPRGWVGLAVTAVAYVVLFWMVGVADFFILHPTREPIPVPEGRRERLEVPGGGVVELWTGRTRISASPGGTPLAYVLDFGPNAGRAEYGLLYGLSLWEGMAVEYVAVNYPGYGGSTGPASLESVHRVALAVYDEVARRAGGRPVFVSGLSLGTTAALHVAARRPVAGLVLHNPVPLRQLILGRFGWWNLWVLAYPVARQIPPELDAIENARRSAAPAVFVTAQFDELVPPTYQQRVIDAYGGPRRVVRLPGGHNDPVEGSGRSELRRGLEWLWAGQVGSEGPAALPRLPTTDDAALLNSLRDALSPGGAPQPPASPPPAPPSLPR